MKIGVVLGGLSAEKAVSYKSGYAVGEALITKGHEVVFIDPALGSNCILDYNDVSIGEIPPQADMSLKENFIHAFAGQAFDGLDCVFDVMHGTLGEDGILQSLLELKGIPYTGSDAVSSAIAMDKVASKLLFLSAGINTPEWVVVNPDEVDDLDFLGDIIGQLGKNLVVKPKDQGSAVGLHILTKTNEFDLQEALRDAAKFDDKILVEQYIPGRELTVGIFGGEAFPVVEIVPKEGHYDYKNKYQKGSTEYYCPANLSEDIAQFTQDMALMAHSVLGCRDYSRVDFRLNPDGQPFCLEVNTVPGFTELSLFPMGALEVGISFADLCERLAEMAFERGS